MKNDAGKEFGGFDDDAFKKKAAEIGPTLRSRAVEEICHQLEDGVIFKSTWLGVPAAKNPSDAWVYQELIFALRPDIIIETGSFKGGGAVFLESMLQLCCGGGDVISVDITKYDKPNHPRIQWLLGSSTQPDIVSHIKARCKGKRPLIILDSDHSYEHVLAEMKAYAHLVPKGGYLIVEDTWVHADDGKGPWPAVEEFMRDNPGMFEIDTHAERYLTTNNPKGFLRRL